MWYIGLSWKYLGLFYRKIMPFGLVIFLVILVSGHFIISVNWLQRGIAHLIYDLTSNIAVCKHQTFLILYNI